MPHHRRPGAPRALLVATAVGVLAIGGVVVATTVGGGRSASSSVQAAAESGPGVQPVSGSTSTESAIRSAALVKAAAAKKAAAAEAAVRATLSAAGGDVAVAVYDAKSGRGYALNDSDRFVTASVVKLSILGTTLRQAQAGRVLTSTDRAELAGMIENSDNDDASDLWNSAGGASAVIGYDKAIGTTATTANAEGYWGLTTTSAGDQAAVMRSIAYANPTLTAASRTYADQLLAGVESDQRWGASGGVPTGVTVLTKNGWLPHGTGWVVNSVAHVVGGGKDYVVAIMSDGNATQAAGIARLQTVSAAVWAAAS